MKFETSAQGKGFHETLGYTCMSDPKFVTELITNRIKLDESYSEKMFPSHLLSAKGSIACNTFVLDVYIDLDMLIQASPLTKKQMAVIELMMRGWTVTDISDEYGIDHSKVSHLLRRAVATMCETNTKRWQKVTQNYYDLEECE